METLEIEVIHNDLSISIEKIDIDTIYTAKKMSININSAISFDEFKQLEEIESFYQ